MNHCIRILPSSPDLPDIRTLINRLDQQMLSLYPVESNHLDSADSLKASHVLLLGAYDGDRAIGCGAVKVMSDDGNYGEIKRIFVLPEYRRRGISRQIMEALEASLSHRGVFLSRLEVGARQPEALGLYAAMGYKPRDRFGSYPDDPISLFFEKTLE